MTVQVARCGPAAGSTQGLAPGVWLGVGWGLALFGFGQHVPEDCFDSRPDQVGQGFCELKLSEVGQAWWNVSPNTGMLCPIGSCKF